MENIEEKAQYFAQYWGQKAVLHGGFPTERVDYSIEGFGPACKLLLIPLSSIANKDAIEVAKIGWDVLTARENQIKIGRQVAEYFIKTPEAIRKTAIAPRNTLRIADFLRSKGYAVPFRNYSVEQLIELGWLKLKH